jgi:hypothetical protein
MAVGWFLVAGLLVLGVFAYLIEKEFFIPANYDFGEKSKKPIVKVLRFVVGLAALLGIIFFAFGGCGSH